MIFDVYREHTNDADVWLGWIEAATREEAQSRAEARHQQLIDDDDDGYNPGGWVRVDPCESPVDLLPTDEYA